MKEEHDARFGPSLMPASSEAHAVGLEVHGPSPSTSAAKAVVSTNSGRPPRTTRLPGLGIPQDSVFKPQLTRFIEGLVYDYWSARLPVSGHPKISRGTARVVASITEERFAELLVETFHQIDQILIDQELAVAGQPLRKPDLVVRKGDEICLFVDIKMDFNWIRAKLPQLATSAEFWMRSVREAGKVGVSERADRSRDKRSLVLSRHCEYIFVVLSGLGTTAYDMCMSLDSHSAAGSGEKHLVRRLVLWPTVHANSAHYATPAQATDDLVQNLSGRDLHALEDICIRTLNAKC